MKITANDIKQIYYLELKIQSLEDDLRDIEEGKFETRLDGMPRAMNNISDPTGMNGLTAAEITQNIKSMLCKLKRRKDAVYKYIESLDDIQLQLAITYRYIKLMTWEQVAAKLGGNNTEASVTMMVRRHFEKMR